MRLSIGLCLLVTCGMFVGASQGHAQNNWPRWRGEYADGHSQEKGLPRTWTKDSVIWRRPLQGRGHSSPTIWGDRIFLTTALGDGKSRVVICVNRADGAILWERTAWEGDPEPSHEMNGWASGTCATEGERVFAFFGRGGGLFCYTVDGELVWSRELGPPASGRAEVATLPRAVGFGSRQGAAVISPRPSLSGT